ncbi:hypothetical protein AAK964_10190 [Tissierella praeacuta]|uniref:hypothetical protein n=1 Tax=Tissierella praeacuta TaxID=43131 RepID=UPI003514BF7B
MYPVTSDYKEKIKLTDRLFEVKIQIQHSKGVLNLGDKDLVQGTLTYTESSQSGEEFTIGSIVASDISFSIMNKSEYKNINFIGATVICNIGLLVKKGIEAHFLQVNQPSTMKGFEEKWEYVPLGRFNIDDAPRQRNTIEIKAIDNMINLDLPYRLSKLSYPATLYQIYINACNVCDILPGTTSFPNMNYIVQKRPDGDLTFRDVIGYVAELSGTFAKCNRNGALELKWYTPTDIVLGPQNRFDFKPSDDTVQIKGIMATVDDTTYLAGNEDYAIDLTDNPLLQGDYKTVLPNIFNNIKDIVFTPYTSDWQGNPAIQAGDMITQIDRDGKIYNTLITKSVYKYRGRSTLEGKGLPEISQGYKGSTNRKIAEIKRKVIEEVGDTLTNYEEAQLNATQLMANMLGGYMIEDDGVIYIADSSNLANASKIWKWGINGFGYSKNGVNGPYTTAITADGSIVAMNIAAHIISADMVNTGILQSEDGSSWFNLDDGTINLKNQLSFIDNQLTLQGRVISREGRSEIEINRGGIHLRHLDYPNLGADIIYRLTSDGTGLSTQLYIDSSSILLKSNQKGIQLLSEDEVVISGKSRLNISLSGKNSWLDFMYSGDTKLQSGGNLEIRARDELLIRGVGGIKLYTGGNSYFDGYIEARTTTLELFTASTKISAAKLGFYDKDPIPKQSIKEPGGTNWPPYAQAISYILDALDNLGLIKKIPV